MNKSPCPFCKKTILDQYEKNGFIFLVHKRHWLTRRPTSFCRVSESDFDILVKAHVGEHIKLEVGQK